MNMSENINIVARRIFNKLSEDISDLRGLSQEWSSISPNVMKLEIRRSWEQIFTDEIEKHTAELQSKVSDLEEANRSNFIVMSALQNAHEMEKARVNRLEEALVAELKNAELRYEQEQRDGDGISIASTRARFIALRDACGILQAKKSNP